MGHKETMQRLYDLDTDVKTMLEMVVPFRVMKGSGKLGKHELLDVRDMWERVFRLLVGPGRKTRLHGLTPPDTLFLMATKTLEAVLTEMEARLGE